MKFCRQDSNLALSEQAVSFTAGTNMLYFTVGKIYNMRKKIFKTVLRCVYVVTPHRPATLLSSLA